MELKDVILSTLAEIEELTVIPDNIDEAEPSQTQPSVETDSISDKSTDVSQNMHNDEIRMLEGIRERLLVLFEGFQSPNNVRIEAKVDLTLNFLEYLLATIDSRLENIKE